MGQTLENGVYLPSEGERNCYAGLKTNWEILDQKVADVTALQQAVAGALHREIVESLPTTDIDPNTIYMILNGTSATENVYNEFMYVNNAWELIGTSATDLTNYYTKGDVDGLLLLKANASDLTSHTGDTTIHVTASDKTKWTNSANTVVLRLAKTALTPSSSTNAFSNLDDATALKVGDKVMDNAGVLFEVTAIDTANSTFTIGSALIDLALDGNVVHKSGNETVSGQKTFTGEITNNITNKTNAYITLKNSSYDPKTNGQSNANSSAFSISFTTLTDDAFAYVTAYGLPEYSLLRLTTTYFTDSENSITDSIEYKIYPNGDRTLRPRNQDNCTLGETGRRWKSVYATNYYYGSNNVEFSTKFVTTDTNQTISGEKTFADYSFTSSGYGFIGQGNRTSYILPEFTGGYSGLSIVTPDFNKSVKIGAYTTDENTGKKILNTATGYLQISTGSLNDVNTVGVTPVGAVNSNLGNKNNKWKQINGVEPSSLGMPVAPSSTSYVDISSYITVLDNSAPNKFTPPSNGYITFHVQGSQVQFMHNYGLQVKWSVQSGSVNRGFVPVLGGVEIDIYVAATDIYKFWFIPCQGNV